MWMNEFVKKLYDFRGIYRIFWNQNSQLDCQKNHCYLILTVGFDFSSNMTVVSYIYIHIYPLEINLNH